MLALIAMAEINQAKSSLEVKGPRYNDRGQHHLKFSDSAILPAPGIFYLFILYFYQTCLLRTYLYHDLLELDY